MTVSQSPELQSSLDPTGLFSSTAPRVSRGRRRGSTPRPTREPDQVHGALILQSNQQHGRVRGLLFGLSTALSLGVRQLLVKGDSQLIVKQVKGECSYNDPQLAAYLLHARKLEKDFEVLDLRHIPCAENAVADDLSAKASTSAPVPDGVLERRLR
jgi:ribonuclease HI